MSWMKLFGMPIEDKIKEIEEENDYLYEMMSYSKEGLDEIEFNEKRIKLMRGLMK